MKKQQKTYQYILTTSEEMTPLHLAQGLYPWIHSRVLHITDVQHPEGNPSYGQVYHVSDGVDNKPDEETTDNG